MAAFVTTLLTLAALAMYYLAFRTTITITAQNDIEKVELGLACPATQKPVGFGTATSLPRETRVLTKDSVVAT